MPSKTETFGLVYAEAMSQGLPILYSAGQGFDGQFPEGTVGFHVDPADARDVAAKIKCVLQNYTELSAHCMKLCTQFDWEQITRRYIELYQRICK